MQFFLGSNQRIAIDDKCTNCSGCIGVCPTSVISNEDFNPIDFIINMDYEKDNTLSCKENSPCLNTFNIEEFISMGLLNKKIVCDLSHCENCDFNKNSILSKSIEENINEANIFLNSCKSENKKFNINLDYEKKESKKPIKKFTFFEELKDDFKPKEKKNEIDTMFDKKSSIPLHRQLLTYSLNKEISNFSSTSIDNQMFSFIKRKEIDFNSCTNCGDCVQFCPTKALTADDDKIAILFQESKCISCEICNDICKPKSFSDLDKLDLISLAFGRATKLIRHNLVICDECKTPFPQKKSEKKCFNCVNFIDEWKDLFTIEKDIKEK